MNANPVCEFERSGLSRLPYFSKRIGKNTNRQRRKKLATIRYRRFKHGKITQSGRYISAVRQPDQAQTMERTHISKALETARVLQ